MPVASGGGGGRGGRMAARGVRCSARLSAAPAPAPQPARRAPPPAGASGPARRARAAERAREVEDGPRVLRDKCRRLARALRNAKHLVVYTGAGISTAADIPDYRGPRGVWTRLQRGETVGRVEVSRARPTFTHMALTALWARGALKFVVSQNCDGLHVRAGLPRRALAELHGDMFAERCAACRALYLRACDVTQRTARHRHGTRRLCHACGAELRDTIVHFGERGRAAWPLNWAGALRHAARADVVLCLGSSLKVLRRYGRLWRMREPPRLRPRLYIVNLQWTPKDKGAALKINARCDEVMRAVARRLRLRVPRYRRARDPLLAHAEPLAPPERHTTRRPLLSPAGAADSASSASDAERDSPSRSPSPSDSDEELPLRALRDRLRVPDPPALRSFRVSMQSGDATILLRAEHAPPLGATPPPRLASELRRVRIARHLPPPPPAPPPAPAPGSAAVKREPAAAPAEDPDASRGARDSHLRRLLELGPRLPPRAAPAPRPPAAEREEREGEEEEEGRSLAAAFFARAVLLCRAELYPGLHTILAAPPPPAPQPGAPPPPPAPAPASAPAEAECAWCLRLWGARRCLWYGPPRRTPLHARAWRREGARRYLCACCGEGAGGAGAGAGAGGQRDDADGGGWYGKGYRKGRRRR